MSADLASTSVHQANPVAVISGGARGIGAATAERLVASGWRVALLDINGEGAQAEAARLGDQNLGLGCDVADQQAVKDVVDQIATHFGRVDAVIPAAGNITRAPAEEFDLAIWQKHLDIHLTGSLLLAQACHSLLAESKGSIVTFASVASTFGLPGRVAYGTVKTGMVGLTRTLAAEWGPHGIRVNAVAPGYVDTEMVRSGFRSGSINEDTVLSRTPLRRLATPEDIAGVIEFLVGPAASFITGVLLPVDGGLIIDGRFDAPSDGSGI
ncbi:SDR family oxidoreductase [Aeromicrobium sp. CFBP 8757]|uniref:SDR family NAD(P)-dependent oxidoreductase n=1 Tax=Aeromicrobium sp. CFBP 8757 TaxID=2775288 RepID=UPI0017838773|nr:SDR family oxidoreductase [Aeromicrobium sp. CFBP 8757]MBD8605401.1 SDR family oxidoreductase [Aeromicrobium sp. CFBP 8757]